MLFCPYWGGGGGAFADVFPEFQASAWQDYRGIESPDKEFARYVIGNVYGAYLPYTSSDKRQLVSGTIIGQFFNNSGVMPSSSDMAATFADAQPGDVIQMDTSIRIHTAIIASIEGISVRILYYNGTKAANVSISFYDWAGGCADKDTGFTIYRFEALSKGSKIYLNSANFPDEAFRNYVAQFSSDGITLASDDIAKVKRIDVHSMKISSLKGIEYFTALESLYCYSNDITQLDLSGNVNLTFLSCAHNKISELNISRNAKLREIQGFDNKLKHIDTSNNSELSWLVIPANPLEEIDVTQNTKLTVLEFNNTNITQIDLSQNTALQHFSCMNSKLTELDLTAKTALTYLNCSNNLITLLNLHGCSSLQDIYFHHNKLTELDVSQNAKLRIIQGFDNKLKHLDTSNNPELTGITVPGNPLEEIDVTQNTKLTALDLTGDRVTHIDLSRNTALERLYLGSSSYGNNKLTELDLTANTALTLLWCYGNQLTTLNLRNNTALKELRCYNNKLKYLNIYGRTALEYVDCRNNSLSALNIGGCTALKHENIYADSSTLIVSETEDLSGEKPEIITQYLGDAAVNRSYSAQLYADSSSSVTWSKSGSLPAGLSISKSGLISGKPLRAGKFNFTVTASNAYGTSRKSMRITVVAPPEIRTRRFGNATEGKSFSSSLNASGTKPFIWTAEGLPDGLSLNASTGKITGIPTESGTYRVKIKARNSAGYASVSLHLTVKASALKLSGTLATGRVNQAYSSSLTLSHSPRYVLWSVEGYIPEGLNFDPSTGIISGTPLEAWQGKLRITVLSPSGRQTKTATLIIYDEAQPTPGQWDVDSLPEVSRNKEPETLTAPENTQAVSYEEERTTDTESINAHNEYIIVGTLPAVSVDEAGMYDFDAVLSDDAPIGAELVYVANCSEPSSDDDIAEFYDDEGEEILHVPENRKITVSVWLNPGRHYEPTIAIKH